MKTIKRLQLQEISSDFFKGKVIVIVGARQVGKTTLLSQISEHFEGKKTITINADNTSDADLLRQSDISVLRNIIGDNEIILVDEAQRIPSIGLTTKILVDYYKESKQIILTGSSSINLLENTSEPLTGRKYTYKLFPISLDEYLCNTSVKDMNDNLLSFLKFGMYPEILKTNSNEEKIRLLKEISSSYLFKDILEFQEIKNPQILNSLLKALALQIGSEVSYTELSGLLGIDAKTIERYVDLLEKSFIVYRLPSYTTNKRREISRNKKILFYDLGIRNAVIDNFSDFDKRQDLGHLWENFIITERMKYREYKRIYSSQYFWRTYDGSEIDLIEEREGNLYGYEIKYSATKSKTPLKWQEYENASYQLINKNHLKGFVV